MIEFERVSKAYEGRPALVDASFTIARGEFAAVVGPSGAGKSTALRLVNRMIEPDAGAIRIGGEDIAGADPVALRRRLGYVIQSIGLFPHWTVARNIATVPHLLRWPAARIEARIGELLDLVGLDRAAFRDRYPHQLSGGEQQRVGLARALAAGPEILLMDEPFGALDAVTRDSLQGEMVRIHRTTGKTILMVTHDIDEALRLASRILVIEDGRVVQNAPPEEIIDSPASEFVRTLFGGETAHLRLLKVRRVGERARPGEAPGDPVAADAPLETALARMLAAGVHALPVIDPNGRAAGVIRMDDLVRRRPS
ncbi:MAG TPA: ABC transporter ATP-binding protein [Bauldia sp.]|nr:ABC transporter ATP-binding protein [Bauldia sp.]